MQSRIRVSNMKKTAVAAIAASALVLAACGSEEEATTAASSKVAAASSKAVSAAADASTTVAEEMSKPAESPSEAPPAAPEATAIPEDLQVPEIPAVVHQPIEAAPASPEDAAAIEGLVYGLNNGTTLRSYMAYIPDNSCQAALDAHGGREALDLDKIPDVPMSQVEQFAQAKPHVDNVTDIRVQGDVASASVTGTSDGETTTNTQRFRRENGRWTFCAE
ncbi:hypothetical protein CMUST_10420 [Corynebacterium mustelae]|uniref:Secreted protein n=1 Tax=Corynebacterium mustelae TaxID=571915 RepID=A0A0G3H0W4_9CORY|nr:hypothetical protein [Corynebacterium mustelae]AKK06400.1 hypothetical protein CMUST_10420 [Corynebacterium mustelae]